MYVHRKTDRLAVWTEAADQPCCTGAGGGTPTAQCHPWGGLREGGLLLVVRGGVEVKPSKGSRARGSRSVRVGDWGRS